MSEPLWALAAGCVPDAAPWDIPRIAHSAGFLSSGMWIDPKTTWDNEALKKTECSLYDTGIKLIDVEAAWLEETDLAKENHKLIVDAGLELGARNVLVVSRHRDYEASISQFRDMCERAGDGIKICIEFGEFTSIKSLAEAKQFVVSVDHPSAGILIDLMHLNRSGDHMPNLETSLFPYIQGCDFWQDSATKTGTEYIEAAVDSRCCLGEGEALASHITQICRSDKDISLEIRSLALREQFSDPYERAKEIFDRCKRSSFL